MNDNYVNMNLKELKQYCRDKEYKGHSKCKTKNDLKEFIKKNIELESLNNGQHIICGKCGERGHHSYKCIKENDNKKDKIIKELQNKIKEYELKEAFEDTEENNNNNNNIMYDEDLESNYSYESIESNSSCESIENLILNIDKNKKEYLEQEEETMKEMTETLKELERLKQMEDNIIKENKQIEDNKKREEQLLDNALKGLDCKIISINKECNEYHKERYNLFINQHNGMYVHDNQIILYHGTDEKNIKPIMENGFSLTTNKVNGAVYGEGIYFTPDIKFAMKYATGDNHNRNIIICQVYVNNIIEGKKAMTTFPKVPGKDEYYDTSVDNLNNSKIYVKKDVEQINILAHIKIEKNKVQSNILSNKTGIKIINNTNKKLKILWHIYKSIIIKDLDINKCCKIMGDVYPGDTFSIHSRICDQFIIGYYDNDKHFNIYNIIGVNKMSQVFTID
jgi:hypothetical protein